jgi:hypothetical protein
VNAEPMNPYGKSPRKKAPEEIITTHINADFDALASLIAAKKLYPDATIVFPGSQEKNLRIFFLHSASYLFNFAKIKQIDFDRIKRLILVDTRQKNLPNWWAGKMWKSTSMIITLIPKMIYMEKRSSFRKWGLRHPSLRKSSEREVFLSLRMRQL